MDTIAVKSVKKIDESLNGRHPTEFMYEESRAKLDYLKVMSKNDAMMFNFPRDYTEEQIANLCKVKGVQVIDIKFNKAINGYA